MQTETQPAPIRADGIGTKLPYLPAADGLRAFCVLGVILNHITHPDWVLGWLGVDVFFVLSGFLITRLLIDEEMRHATVSLKGFYTRRFFRIVPVYLFATALYGAAVWATHDVVRTAQYKIALPYLLTFLQEYRPASSGNVFGQAWTLGIEEKFYLVWPLLVLVLYPFRGRAQYAPFALGVALLFLPQLFARSYNGLLFGAILAIALSGTVKWRVTQYLRTLPAWLICIGVAIGYGLTMYRPELVLFFSFAVALLLGSLVVRAGALRSFLSHPALVFVGKRSYSMYLIHMLVINVIEKRWDKFAKPNLLGLAAISFVFTLLGASLMYIAIERPCIGIGRKLSSRYSQALLH